jgi:hypothetical protein
VPDIPGDSTPPDVRLVISGTLGDAGWYTSNVTVNWLVVDPESIVLSTTGCDARTLTANTMGTRLACTAVSDGGETTVAKTFKLDKTAPTASASSRPADVNGWYNDELTVDFVGDDTTSGLHSCSPDAVTYEGPDTVGTSLVGSCRDVAGNTAPVSFLVKYDETPPEASAAARPTDANGWYNKAVTVTFQGSDATSGVGNCSQETYAGPDDPSVALIGTCRDQAGNESPSSTFTLQYDETAPVATATARPPDANGWYNASLTVSFAATDATSGFASCDPPKTYSAPDSKSASVGGACRDHAGNVAQPSFAFRYDRTPPQVAAAPRRQPNANDWYNAPLTVDFAGTDPISGVVSCAAPKTYPGPDDGTAALSGTCLDEAGNVGSTSFAFKYDATRPVATATARSPDANGWYNAPLTVSFAATDALSGPGPCTVPQTYSSPDSLSASRSGTCFDGAGNESAETTYAFKYDATPPAATATARPPDANGWYNGPLTVSFSGSDATSGLVSCDAPKTYSSPDSKSTSVDGECRDPAGNVAQPSFAFRYDRTAPQVTATPKRPPNANQWYNAPLEVTFAGTDPISGGVSCDAPKTYSTPDSLSASLSGTCRDEAGNLGSNSFGFKYDATAPVATATARPPDANGWYNAPLTVSFAATDALSGPGACTAPQSYSTPDTLGASLKGTCLDQAGNRSAETTFSFKYDATPPLATATPDRLAGASGWYNRPLTITFNASDATSGFASCDPPETYSTPDTPSASLKGTCLDVAGNRSAEKAFAFKYDATAPQATATLSRPPNENGWFNAPLTVTFSGTDATSGPVSCPQPQSYDGPDSAAAVISGTCLDKAGNGALASLAVRYDATAPTPSATPSRQPDANGWYNAPLTVSFAATDALSGPGSCTAPKGYSTPDSRTASLSGNCLDRAGNRSAETTFAFKYDGTAPLVTEAIPVRSPDRAGWYNRPVAFSVQGTDATAGIATCPAVTYTGADGGDASVLGFCLDQAGNEGTRSFPLSYDTTGPRVTARPSHEPSANGWYSQPVTVSFVGEDSVSGLDSCTGPESYEGPDSPLAVISGFCLDKAGNPGVVSHPVQFDATAPQVTGVVPERQTDAAGWYNHPLAVSFQGTDETSGLDACTEARYGGPDALAAAVSGSCRDRAGNGSAAASFVLRYDATAPTLSSVTAKAGNRTASLSWAASPDTVLVEVRRSGRLVYRGTESRFTDTGLQNGTRYRYALSGYDEARNVTTAHVAARPTAPLISPAAGARVSAPPRLVWTAVPKATHYNVQLWRRGKILSAWPRRASMRLERTWMYGGRRYRLTPGRYRWYVWPGYGRRAAKRFGPLLGSSSFLVIR